MEKLDKNKALHELITFKVELNQPMKNYSYREGVLIKGEFGWAEFAPFPHHSIEHSTRWLQAALEMAWTKLPEPGLNKVKTNAIAVSPDVQKAIQAIKQSGSNTLKIKLNGEKIDEEINSLKSIQEEVKNIKFRIDFNGDLTIDEGVEFSNKLTDLPVEYLEQPCKTLEENKILKHQINIPIAIDENFRLHKDPLDKKFIEEILEIADYLIVKVIPLGGISRFLKLRETISPSFNRIVISGSMDTSVGLYLSALAQSLVENQTNLLAGVGTGLLLKNDVIKQSIVPVNGFVEVRRPNVVKDEIVESPNSVKLLEKINDCFDYGRNQGWF